MVCLNAVSGTPRFSERIGSDRTWEERPAPLQLTVEIVSQEYCTGDSELDRLQLKVRLTYRNRGKKQLILYKGSSLISRIMISQSPKDAAAKRFEVDSSLTQLISGGSKCYTGAVPSTCFAILPPGASYDVEATIAVFAVGGEARDIIGAVKSGKHFLQIKIITWQKSGKLARELQARWRRYGTLWYEPIKSAPLPFIIEKERQVADCP